jgi:hypothetical protein
MTVHAARETARQWVIGQAAGIPGFRGGYTAGSTNWRPGDAALPAGSDFDIMVVLADPAQASTRGKFRFRDLLLDPSYVNENQLQSAGQVLADYHLAPSLETAAILLDPTGHLAALQQLVRRDYADSQWVRHRCAAASDRILRHLRSLDDRSPVHDQAIACLFGTGVTTHVLLVAGLRNPTIRARYVAVRELLAERDLLDFHELLLDLLGAARITRVRALQHLAALAEIFDRAAKATPPPFPFASDLSDIARPIAIDGSLDLIECGYHREAMFWIAVTHSRCQKALAPDAASEPYLALLADLGISSPAEIRRRADAVEHSLPPLWNLADRIISPNQHP